MRIAIIGRTEILYDTALRLRAAGHEIACVVSAKEAPEYTRTLKDFEGLAADWGVPFAKGPRIEAHQEFLRTCQADIGVSINFTGVIPQSAIDIFPLGILNAHGGDLPRYRGNACQAWAILNGEKRIGLCIHRMVGGELDSGDIVARDYLGIDHTIKVTRAWEWMTTRAPELMLDAIQRLSEDSGYVLEVQSTDPKDALRCYPRRPEDGRIDWIRPAIDVLRLVNASNRPYAGAFCYLDGAKLTIWDAELVDDNEVFCAVPGQVTRIGDGFVEVACGPRHATSAAKLRLLSVELDGRTAPPNQFRMSTRQRLQ
jgi:methionyl-tRNA formyltransferase